MKIIKIFLASSSELVEDRREFELFLSRENKDYIKQGYYLELVIWEDFLDAMSKTRLQDEYNKAIQECDLFVMLFFTKVGKYTEEEFDTAWNHFQANGKPFLFTYFKDNPISTSAISDNILSLLTFKKRLDNIGHFYTSYTNTDGLKLHFSKQLKKLFSEGKLPATNSTSPPTIQTVTQTTPPIQNPIPNPTSKPTLKQLKKDLKRKLASDNLQKAFDQLDEVLSDESGQYNFFIGLLSRFNRNKKQELKGLITAQQANMEYAKLNQSVQYLIDELEEGDLV